MPWESTADNRETLLRRIATVLAEIPLKQARRHSATRSLEAKAARTYFDTDARSGYSIFSARAKWHLEHPVGSRPRPRLRATTC